MYCVFVNFSVVVEETAVPGLPLIAFSASPISRFRYDCFGTVGSAYEWRLFYIPVYNHIHVRVYLAAVPRHKNINGCTFFDGKLD